MTPRSTAVYHILPPASLASLGERLPAVDRMLRFASALRRRAGKRGRAEFQDRKVGELDYYRALLQIYGQAHLNSLSMLGFSEWTRKSRSPSQRVSPRADRGAGAAPAPAATIVRLRAVASMRSGAGHNPFGGQIITNST